MNRIRCALLWWGACVLACTLLAIAVAVLCYVSPSVSGANQQGGESYAYVLRETDGKIGLYLPDEDQPRQILNIYTYTLPEQDQESLETGIRVKDDADLEKYIEEFDS